MTDYADLQTQIADWANRQDWQPTLVQSFIHMAEQKFNSELRIDRMILTVDATIASQCAPLPDDWLEMDFVRIENNYMPTGFSPLNYKPRDEFFRINATPYYGSTQSGYLSTQGKYTIEGRQIFIGGEPDATNGRVIKIDYYAEVPVFSDTQDSWVYTKYPALYLYASLMHADLHAVGEEDKSAMLNGLVQDMIAKLNADHRYARASGSRLARSRVRSFG